LTIAIGSSQLLCKPKKKDAVIAAIEGSSSSVSSSSYHHLSLSNPPTETPDTQEMYISHWDFSFPHSNRTIARELQIKICRQIDARRKLLRTQSSRRLLCIRNVETLGTYYSQSRVCLYPECGNPRGISVSQCRVPPEEWAVLEVSICQRWSQRVLTSRTPEIQGHSEA
jgi:hypothetical protein